MLSKGNNDCLLQESNGTLKYKVWTQYRALRVNVAVCTKTRLPEAEECDIQSCYCLINCTQNVTLRRFHETIVAVEKQKVLHISVCVCVGGGGWMWMVARARSRTCASAACDAPPYCLLRSLWLDHIFRHYLINGKVFEKRL